jgi:hypothetical protein
MGDFRERKTRENLERPSKNKDLTRIEGGVIRFIKKSRLGIIHLSL